MNTKTMRLPPRRVLTPSANATTNKRKERDDPLERPKPIIPHAPTSKLLKPDRPTLRPNTEPIATTSSGSRGLDPTITTSKIRTSNQLLAGYLAHEFLTKGTLMGKPWVPPRAEGAVVAEKRKGKIEEEEDGGGEATAASCRMKEEEKKRYAEVAGLLKGGGTHLSGVVNPTQLARFLHL